MGFKVCAERCENCLFGKAPIVDDRRRKQIVRDLAARDTHFVCHLHGTGGEEGLVGEEVCCRGDYDRDPQRTNLMRIAARLGAVEFVGEGEVEHG